MAQASGLPFPAVTGNVKTKNLAAPVQFVTEKSRQLLASISELVTPGSNSSSSNQSTTPTPQEDDTHHNERPRLTVTEEEVLQHINAHKKFRLPDVEGVEVADLPSFDEFTQYGKVTDDSQRELWSKEVSRLVSVVTSRDPLTFCGSQDLAVDSIKAYETFTNLADRFLQALGIVSYDGECLLAEHDPDLCQVGPLERSRVTLSFICNKEEDGDNDDDDPPAIRLEDLFAFIDHCTAVLARILYAHAESKEAAHRMLSHVAKISAKAKVVSVNPEDSARISIDTGISEAELAALHKSSENPRRNADAGQGWWAALGLDAGVAATPGRGGDWSFGHDAPDRTLDLSSKKGALRHVYFSQCAVSRFGLIEVLMHIIVRVRGSSRLVRASYSSHEISAIVYTTGFGSFQTLVFQDRDNNFDGSSDQAMVDSASHAFGLLNDTVRHIKETSTRAAVSSGNDSEEESVGNQMTWAYVVYGDSELKEKSSTIGLLAQERVDLRSMSDVISVLVPLLFVSPMLVRHVNMALEAVSAVEQQYVPQQGPDKKPRRDPPPRYAASFCLDTREHRDAQSRLGEKDSKSLSHSLIRRNGLFSGKGVTQIGRVNTDIADPSGWGRDRRAAEERKAAVAQIHKNQAELDAAKEIMKTWVLEEKGVMVTCKLYVSAIMAACTLLTVGGIVVGITVGERISGVDPFNITTYCWVLAAFLVLVAKSVRVHEWPWNDFLRGRVLCKSVSELSSVTGMHAQLIIAYLLECEDTSFLETRGPFHIVFPRKADDGFSIDEPLSMWTLLLSGLIMIEVESSVGPSLVCLDLRKGTNHSEVKSRHAARSGDPNSLFLCCVRLQDQSIDIYSNEPRARLAYANGMSWSRAVGVYGNNKAVFV
ncbi:hypothetical protein B0T16DRAFT_423251 [Cercophora newfieldiana]|uniref:Uncharacterized protein n=1 Tax=Cercophora newfieldiana TaxID=92897 RepID=A0AA39XSL3_9PEZI|nr:hypothetical protein B0T16DRAFT_423251 [Cercophora newfieldiana]